MTRGEYLFDLAHVCHVSPHLADDLRIGDFVQLLAGIRQYWEAKAKTPSPPGRGSQ